MASRRRQRGRKKPSKRQRSRRNKSSKSSRTARGGRAKGYAELKRGKRKKEYVIKEYPPILDGREGYEFLYRRFFRADNPKAKPELRVVVSIGSPGSGKSYGTEIFVNSAFEDEPERFNRETVLCLQERDVGIAIKKMRADAGHHKYVFMRIEDALDAADSRESMGKAQRVMTQHVFRLRHTLGDMFPEPCGGKILICFTIQIAAIDKRIINMADALLWTIRPGHEDEWKALFKKLGRKDDKDNVTLINWFLDQSLDWHNDHHCEAILQFVVTTPVPERFALDLNHLADKKLPEKYADWWPELPLPPEEREDEGREFEADIARKLIERIGPDEKIDQAIFYSELEEMLADLEIPQLSPSQIKNIRYRFKGMSRKLTGAEKKLADERIPDELPKKELKKHIKDGDRINRILHCFDQKKIHYSDTLRKDDEEGYTTDDLWEILDGKSLYWQSRNHMSGWMNRKATLVSSKLGCKIEHKRNAQGLRRRFFWRSAEEMVPKYEYCLSNLATNDEGNVVGLKK